VTDLDVHAASVRLAAVRGDELLDERTLLHDHEAVERAVRAGRECAAAMRRGRPVTGWRGICAGVGIACDVVAPGLVPVRPGISSRPIRASRGSVLS
jgi:hypothetical protein